MAKQEVENFTNNQFDIHHETCPNAGMQKSQPSTVFKPSTLNPMINENCIVQATKSSKLYVFKAAHSSKLLKVKKYKRFMNLILIIFPTLKIYANKKVIIP